MILINKGANNLIDLTLAEKSTLALPYYLFVFKNDITKQSVKFIPINSSAYRHRYDRFLITETSGTNIYTSGVITLNPTGYWFLCNRLNSFLNLSKKCDVIKLPIYVLITSAII